jgi:rRNA-processing protein FCF1
MTDSPSAYVLDANILIDVHAGGLSREVFCLPFRLVAPDVIVAELEVPDGQVLLEYGLQAEELSADYVQRVVELRVRYRQVSAQDLFALVLAQKLGVTLLTGDRQLTRVAAQEGVAFHGTLWLLDEMVRLRIIGPARAAEALTRMLERGSRLPVAECRTRFQRWTR